MVLAVGVYIMWLPCQSGARCTSTGQLGQHLGHSYFGRHWGFSGASELGGSGSSQAPSGGQTLQTKHTDLAGWMG